MTATNGDPVMLSLCDLTTTIAQAVYHANQIRAIKATMGPPHVTYSDRSTT